MNHPSSTQLDVIRHLLAHGGVIERWPGGFWTTADDPTTRAYGGHRIPTWSTITQTIRAMEKRGWVERTFRFKEDWRDDRRLTPAGVVAATGGASS